MAHAAFHRVLASAHISPPTIHLEHMIKLWGSNPAIELACYDVLVAEPVLGFRRLEAKKKSVATYQNKKIKKIHTTGDLNPG